MSSDTLNQRYNTGDLLSPVHDELSRLYRYDEISNVPVGRGGCGTIWRARDVLYDRLVAIKTIDENLRWSDSDKARRTFVTEAKAGARLGQLSRHIVEVLDLGFAGDVPFFTMAWIEAREGRSAIDISADMGAISLTEAISVLFQVSDAVATAHEHHVVHSDIAPWNIIYDPRERVYKLADFGLLRILENTLVSAGSGSLLTGGRAAFMPADVLTRKEDIGYASDVYALAVTFRALVEGSGFLDGLATPTPPVIRIKYSGRRDAPPQVRQLLVRFIDEHTRMDNVRDFVYMLQRIPG